MSEERSPKIVQNRYDVLEDSQIEDDSSQKKIDEFDHTPEDLELDVFSGSDGPKKDMNSVFEKKNDGESKGNVKSKMRSRIAGKAKVVDEE